jgi:type IV secretory pathway protease TraF
LTQSSVSSWPYGSQTVTQYNLQISHTCAGMTLTELTLEVSNWDPVNFWNVDASTASSSGDAMLTMPSYFALTDGQTYTVGYQTAAGQACVSVAEFTFQ